MKTILAGDQRLEAQELVTDAVRPMNIAVLVRSFPAISETFVLNRVIGLLQRGHSVDIFAVRPRAEAKVHHAVYEHQLLDRTFYASWPLTALVGVDKLAWEGLERAHSKPYLRYLIDVLSSGRSAASVRLFHPDYPQARRPGYDIILSFFGSSGLRGLELRRLGMGGKLVTTFGGYDLGSFCESHGEDVYDDLFRKGDLFLPVCNFFKEKLISLGCDESKIVVHQDGIDVNRFACQRKRNQADGKIRLIIVARLIEKKGIKYAIEAFARAVKRQGNLHLNIVGEGPEMKSLEALTERLGVRDAVDLCGLKDTAEIVGLLERSDIALNTSIVAANGDIDGIPNTLKEAMAAGLPVIASSVSGIPELVEDGVSGYLVPQADVDAITDRIICLAGDPPMRESMGEHGRKFVIKNYCIDKLMEREIELYQNLVR